MEKPSKYISIQLTSQWKTISTNKWK